MALKKAIERIVGIVFGLLLVGYSLIAVFGIQFFGFEKKIVLNIERFPIIGGGLIFVSLSIGLFLLHECISGSHDKKSGFPFLSMVFLGIFGILSLIELYLKGGLIGNYFMFGLIGCIALIAFGFIKLRQ